MGSRNASWKSSKPHRNDAFARESQAFPVGVTVLGMGRYHRNAQPYKQSAILH